MREKFFKDKKMLFQLKPHNSKTLLLLVHLFKTTFKFRNSNLKYAFVHKYKTLGIANERFKLLTS